MNDERAMVTHDGKCSGCGADLHAKHAIHMSTDGWYSYNGQLREDGMLEYDTTTTELSDFTQLDSVTCSNCSRSLLNAEDEGLEPTGMDDEPDYEAALDRSIRDCLVVQWDIAQLEDREAFEKEVARRKAVYLLPVGKPVPEELR